MMPWIALSVWPVLSIIISRLTRISVAVPLILLGGYLFLPERTGINLPVLPTLNKESIPALVALVLTAIACRPDRNGQLPAGVRPGWIPQDKVVQVCLALLVVGVFGTTLTNGDAIASGNRPALRFYDSFAAGLILLMLLLPFLLGRKVLASLDGQKDLLNVLLVLAMAYSLLALWEVRMSPQLNRTVYGFFPHAWDQHIRGSGFRPLVFLVHGLWLAIFFASAVMAAAAASRMTDTTVRWKYGMAAAWLFMTVFLSNSLGAFMIVLMLLPVALFMPRRLQTMTAAGIAIVVLLYPMVRAADLVPTQKILSAVERIEPARARSLGTRFSQEDALLARAKERPIFGWGGWNRARIISEDGRDLSVTDGLWVTLFGQGGWFRYLGVFGLLTWGVIAMFFRQRTLPDPVSVALALALTANLVDLIPNSGMSPLTWLLAGMLAGRLEEGAEQTNPSTVTNAGTNTGTNIGRSGRQQPVLRRDLKAKDSVDPARRTVTTSRQATVSYRRDHLKNPTRRGEH